MASNYWESDETYSYIGDKGDIGYIDYEATISSFNYKPDEESDLVNISIPFPLVDGKPRSGLVGETIYDSVTIKNITDESLDLWEVRVYDSKPEDCFTISAAEAPNANSDVEYISRFMESSTMDDRTLEPNQAVIIWISCKPKEIGLHVASIYFTVGDEAIERMIFVMAEDIISKSLASAKPDNRSRGKKQLVVNVREQEARYIVGPRPSKGQGRGFGLKYRLPEYPIPGDIKKMISNRQIPGVVIDGLAQENYCAFFKTLLAMEEIKLEEDMRGYGMERVSLKSTRHQLLSLEVPGLAEKRPSLVSGDFIFVKLADVDDTENVPYQRLPYAGLDFPENVVLEDKNHNKWKMKMELHEVCWYFTDGWIEFMNDNRLVDGDIIFCKYIREGVFSFRIFDLSACDKKIVGPFRFCANTKENYNIIEEDVLKLNEIRDGIDKELEDSMQENHDDIEKSYRNDIEVENPVYGNKDNIEESCPHDREVGDPVYEGNIGYACTHDIEMDDPVHEKEDNIGGLGTRDREVDDQDEHEQDNVKASNERLRNREQWLGTKIFESGLAARPTNPYFVTKFQSSRRSELYIPRHILNTPDLEFPPTMDIVDPYGRSYVLTRSKMWGNDYSKIYYSGGWRVLCRSNMVTAGDHCIVEFVREGARGNLQGRVSFVRANNM